MTESTRVPGDEAKLLSIYLRDHLAGAAGGVALFRRAARNASNEAHRELLQRLARDVAEDAAELRRVAGALGVRRPRVKEFIALAGERVARAKFNGRILRRSPTSDLVESEAMILGLTGQILAWRSLAASDFADALAGGADLARFEARALEQRRELEQLQHDVVREVFAARRSGAPPV